MVAATLVTLGRDFNRLWAGTGVSNLADGLLRIALPLYVVTLTDSPIAVAALTAVANLSWLVFGLPAGTLNDRFDRRRTMVAVSLGRGCLLGALAAAAAFGWATLPLVYATVFMMGVGETLFDSAAPAIVPSVVERADLARANSRRYAVELTANEFVGPPVAGFLNAVRPALAFASSCALYLCAAVLIVSMSARPRPSLAATTMRADLRDGLRFALRQQYLRVVALWAFGANLAGAITFSVLVLHAVTPGPLGLSSAGYGLLIAGLGLGGLAGAGVAGRVGATFGVTNSLTVASIAM